MSKINLTIELLDNYDTHIVIKRILSLNCEILNLDSFNTMITSNLASKTEDTKIFVYRNNLYKIPDDREKFPQIRQHNDGNMYIINPFPNSLEDIYLKHTSNNLNHTHKVYSQIELTNIINHYKYYADYSKNCKTNKPIKIEVNDIDINEFLQKEKDKLYKQFIKLKKYSYIDYNNDFIKDKLNNLDIQIDNLHKYIESENHQSDKFKLH